MNELENDFINDLRIPEKDQYSRQPSVGLPRPGVHSEDESDGAEAGSDDEEDGGKVCG